MKELGLIDTGRALGAVDVDGQPFTFDARANPYALLGYFRDLPSETIDYVFCTSHPRLRPTSARVVFRDLQLKAIDGKPAPVALSDHYGLLTTFTY